MSFKISISFIITHVNLNVFVHCRFGTRLGAAALLSGLRHCALIKTIPELGVNDFIYSLSVMKEMEVISNINNRLSAHIGLGVGDYGFT